MAVHVDIGNVLLDASKNRCSHSNVGHKVAAFSYDSPAAYPSITSVVSHLPPVYAPIWSQSAPDLIMRLHSLLRSERSDWGQSSLSWHLTARTEGEMIALTMIDDVEEMGRAEKVGHSKSKSSCTPSRLLACCPNVIEPCYCHAITYSTSFFSWSFATQDNLN